MKHTKDRTGPVVRIRMGAAHWDITAYAPYDLNGRRLATVVDLRKLDKDGQRKAMFEVVKYVRIARDQRAAA